MHGSFTPIVLAVQFNISPPVNQTIQNIISSQPNNSKYLNKKDVLYVNIPGKLGET
jgi:hypothetical protein